MTKPEPILTSPALTALIDNRVKQNAKAAHSRSEVWRLTKHKSRLCVDETVTRATYVAPHNSPPLDFSSYQPDKSATHTGPTEQEVAARNEDILQRTLAGESLPDTPGIEEALQKEHAQWHEYERAIERLDREIEKERVALAIEYSKKRQPEHDKLLRDVCKKLLDLRPAWSALYEFRRHFIDEAIGLRGMCLNMPTFLGSPGDKHSPMADFLNTAKRDGIISAVPADFV